MKAAHSSRKIVAAAILVFVGSAAMSQEFSAGINTDAPNPNAVLHLVSPNGNQGLLIPKLTTAQRNGMALSATDNGLLVYDDEEGLFYYWLSPSWIPLNASGAVTTDGATLSGDGTSAAPLKVNAGTGADQLVQLNSAGQLPAVDGSLLTNVAGGDTLISAPGTRNLLAGDHAAPGLSSGTDNTLVGESAGSSLTTGSGNVLIGSGANASATSAKVVAIGTESFSPGNGGIAIGSAAQVNNPNGIAIGSSAQANANNAVAIGQNTLATEENTVILGDGVNSNFNVGIGTPSPHSALQIGPSFGLFHFENTTASRNAEVITDNIYPSRDNLLRLNGDPSSMLVLDNGRFDFVRITAGAANTPIDITDASTEVRSSLTLSATGDAEFGGAIRVADFTGTTATAREGMIQFTGGKLQGFQNGDWRDLTGSGDFFVDADKNHIGGPSAGGGLTGTGAQSNIMIGENAGNQISIGDANVVIGQGADVTDDSDNNIVLGTAANTNGQDAIAIGNNARALSTRSVAIGAGASVTNGISDAMAFGTGTAATQANTIILGDGVNTGSNYDVGIGTATPAGRLDVAGDVVFRGNLTTIPDPTVFNVAAGTRLSSKFRVVKIQSAVTGTINEIEPGVNDGQELLIICISGNTFLDSTGNLRLNQVFGATGTFNMQEGSTLQLMWVRDFNKWVEISRSL